MIVARNYRTPWHKSELDLVGWNEGVLCFIEVKTRTTRAVAPAEAAVDAEKRNDLRRVARQYLRQAPERHADAFRHRDCLSRQAEARDHDHKRAFSLCKRSASVPS